MNERRTKIFFPISKDETGWPPTEGETLWAHQLGPGRYQVVNIPFFVPDLAWGDEVSARPGARDMLEFVKVTHRSGHSTFWVIPLPTAFGVADTAAVVDAFAAIGIAGEAAPGFSLVAFDVPPDADVAAARALAEKGNAEGRWEAVMGYAAPAWHAATQ